MAHFNVPTIGALRTVCLPPLANVPAQRTQRTNSFASERGDKTTMQPFATLLWTLLGGRLDLGSLRPEVEDPGFVEPRTFENQLHLITLATQDRTLIGVMVQHHGRQIL